MSDASSVTALLYFLPKFAVLRVAILLHNLHSRGVKCRLNDRFSEVTVVYINGAMHHGPLTIEDEGDILLRRVGKQLHSNAASHPRRPNSSIKKFGKGKFELSPCLPLSHMEEWSYSSTNSLLDGGERSTSHPGRFRPGRRKVPGKHWVIYGAWWVLEPV